MAEPVGPWLTTDVAPPLTGPCCLVARLDVAADSVCYSEATGGATEVATLLGDSDADGRL